MEHSKTDLLINYWSALRRGRCVPEQGDIHPRAISQVLSTVFTLDASIPSYPLYRLAGTALCKRFGFELKGTSFLAQWDGQSSEILRPLLHRALVQCRPIWIQSMGHWHNIGTVDLETMLAPISATGCEPSRFIGVAEIVSTHTPLSGMKVTFECLSASELVWEADLLSELTTATSAPALQSNEASFPSREVGRRRA